MGISKLGIRLIYVAYIVASIVCYLAFHALLGIGIWRNALAAVVGVSVLVAYSRQLRPATVLSMILLVQLGGPLFIAVVGLAWFVGASPKEVLQVLPEIALYGVAASGLSFTIFLVSRKLKEQKE